jgi:bacteriophage N4 adsorption protein B
MNADYWAWIAAAVRELMLFSAVGFAVFGVDDLCVDIIWIGRHLKRSLTIYRFKARANASMLAAPVSPFKLAIFIPAWDESAVIGQMLGRCGDAWGEQGYTIFVGNYPNDPLTFAAVNAVPNRHVHIVTMTSDGPTTKADCLNHLWTAMVVHETLSGMQFEAIILHDAEDFVHSDELRVFGTLINKLDFIQLPVRPEIDLNSRWISGHYLDEFAEAHLKEMVVREAIGASLPSAGTGCCVRRSFLAQIADLHGGEPFDPASLTEDYELGLRIGSLGGRSGLVRIKEADGKNLVSVRAHFPANLVAAVRQKSRWVVGIAFAGWDRTGWRGGVAEHWMRWRDRRCLLAALFILSAYLALVAGTLLATVGQSVEIGPALYALLLCNGFLFAWRLGVRAFCVALLYGPQESVRSVFRVLVSNLIALLACFYAIIRYERMLRVGEVTWGKTSHRFLDSAPNPR